MLKKLRRMFGKLSPTKPAMIMRSLPANMDDIGDYQEQFEQALLFTKNSGFDVPPLSWLEQPVLTADGDFIRKAAAVAGVNNFAGSGGQCLKWCHYLRPYFEQTLGVPVWLTIGQIWANNKPLFDPSWDDLRYWSASGISPIDLAIEEREGINLHAWLTVATGEIIEPTLLSSLALGLPERADSLRGGITWGREPEFIEKHRYFPMTVGDAIAEAIGGNPQFPLLAKSKEDLESVPWMMMPKPRAAD